MFITFLNKQKMAVPKDTFLLTWLDVCIFFFFKFHQDKTSAFLTSSAIKKNLSQTLDKLNLVVHFCEWLNFFPI